ncbi:hypothetical protein BC628DRAFT_1335137 [Trametes gibbosa]|nr:hypothetical protein BC628DRAFT_1335137 [Trametes gibbosa]
MPEDENVTLSAGCRPEGMRCNANAPVTADLCLDLSLSIREANSMEDVPFAIVKRTSEIHRERVCSEGRLFNLKAEVALLSDAIISQVGRIEFVERCTAADKVEATSVRYKVSDLERKLRDALTHVNALKRANVHHEDVNVLVERTGYTTEHTTTLGIVDLQSVQYYQ